MLSKLFQDIKAFYLYRKKRFAHFLSFESLDDHNTTQITWAFYKLGMYKTVRSLTIDKNSPLSLIAFAVAYAACGETDKSKKIITIIERKFPQHLQLLVEELTAFDIDSTLNLVQKYNLVSLLSIAILVQHQKLDLAEKFISTLKKNNIKNTANLFLIQAQINFHKDISYIEYINQIFKLYKLTEIKKIDQYSCLNIQNIIPINPPKNSHQPYLISILITCYNSEKYIHSTLNSILQQSYQNIEIIIIDDCSTDQTWEIIQRYAKNDTRIQVHQLPFNTSTYVAKNLALLFAKGEFVTCHDADDWSHPQKLELQLQPLLRNPKIIATTSNWFRLSNFGEIYSRKIYPIARLNLSSLLFRRKIVMDKIGFWDCVKTGADSEFLNRLKLQFGDQAVLKVDIPLSIGAHHPASLMNAPETGFIDQKIPASRLDYWEAWNTWHIQALKNKTSLYIPLFNTSDSRNFDIPYSLKIEDKNLKYYQNFIKHQYPHLE